MLNDLSDLVESISQTFASGPITPCSACPAMDITVSVRRDYPIRESEKFGAWLWTDASGVRGQQAMEWNLPFGPVVGRDSDLSASRDDPITGWSIGKPVLGRQGSNGGQGTTDREQTIGAEVKLMRGFRTLDSQRTSGKDGLAVLDTTGLSGDFSIVIVPDCMDDAANVGPSFLAEATGFDKIYRSLKINISLRNGELDRVVDPYDPPLAKTSGRVGNHRAFMPSRRELPVSLKPIWWKTGSGRARRAGRAIDMVIIHCTSGARLGNALINHWLPRNAGPHYVLDVDGHLLKLVNDDKRVSHVANTLDRWERDIHRVSNNERSIGIEIINPIGMPGYRNGSAYVANDNQQPYTYEQYQALINLCQGLLQAFPNIQHRIIGHNDISCGNPRGTTGTANDELGRRKQWDPGKRFEWERLEAAGLGMIASNTASPNIYDEVFIRFPGVILGAGDRDSSSRYGQTNRTNYTGTPIAAIKADLRQIGYSLRNVDGNFDRWTVGAVDRFKRHFFSGSRGQTSGGEIDQDTASMIRRVKLAYFP